MSLIDTNLILSNAQSLVGGGTILSTNQYDFRPVDVPVNQKQALPRYLLDYVPTIVRLSTVLAGTTPTLTVNLISSDNSSMTNPMIHASSPLIGLTGAGAAFNNTSVDIPLNEIDPFARSGTGVGGAEGGYGRYLALQYVMTGTVTAGAINAFIAYAKDFNQLS